MELNPDREERARAKVVPRLPGAYRTRRQAAEYLQSRGYPISFSTLTKLCATGEGPEPAAWWSSRPRYTEPMLDTWADGHSRPTKERARERPSSRST
jgi:hypothetical protein